MLHLSSGEMSGFDGRTDGHRARNDNAPNELDLTDETVPPGAANSDNCVIRSCPREGKRSRKGSLSSSLKSSTAYETLDRSVLRPRLLLGLNGIGTNAGFQRMAGLQSGTTAKDLAYVRRRYITVETPGLVVRELGGYWRAASLARMTVCRLVPYRFASADTLAPAAICSCAAVR
jgi:hypothetical protein